MQEDRLSADVAVDSARTWIVMVALCSVLIALIVAWSTARSIQVPLVRINRVLGLMAQGDMTLRVRYPARNELGEVANSIDQLAHHTKTLLMEVQTGSGVPGERDAQDRRDRRAGDVAGAGAEGSDRSWWRPPSSSWRPVRPKWRA